MDSADAIPTPPETPDANQQQTTAQKSSAPLLERLSRALVNALNEHDFDFNQSPEAQEVLACISPHFKADMDTQPQSLTWDEQIASWKERAGVHPDVRFEVKQVSSDVNERSGVAKVYMDMEVRGLGNVTLHAMNELRWRKMHGKWLYAMFINMLMSTRLDLC
jgi:hypothetical protein